jgi:phosphatidylglycerophosphate synthase
VSLPVAPPIHSSGSTDPSRSPTRRRWLTRANALTATRLAAAPALAIAVTGGAPGIAFLLFWLAVATDLLDGPVARRYGEVTALGGLLDHAADATFVTLGLGALAFSGEVPGALPWLVAGAFLQYTFDSRAVSGRPLRASSLGRWNGVAYFVLLGVPIVRDALGLPWPPSTLVLALGWLLVLATLVSMADRLLALRRSGSVPSQSP